MRSTGDCEPSLFRRLRRFGGLLGGVIVLYTKSDTRLYTDAVGEERFHMHGLDNRAIAFGLFALFTFLLTPECAKALQTVTLITDFLQWSSRLFLRRDRERLLQRRRSRCEGRARSGIGRRHSAGRRQ